MHKTSKVDGLRNSDAGSNWECQGVSVNDNSRETTATGNNQHHNILSPFISCHIFKRVK